MISVSFIVGFWQFGSAGMLAWGAAAAIPILIHLWSRRRYRPEAWAAMAFLLAAVRKNSRRLQLEQWLLLALRCAILVLFALALADPQWSSSSSTAGGAVGGPTHVVIVIDGSYSMDYRASEKSRFDTAKQRAKQLVAAGQQGDGYSMLLLADPPKVVIARPAFDKAELTREIDDLQLTHGGAKLPATLAEVESLLRRSSEQQAGGGRFVSRRVCIYTDLQQTTWSEVNSPDCRALLTRLESLGALELVDLGQADDSNLAVAHLSATSAMGGLVAARQEIQIQVDVQSFSDRDLPRQPLQLLVDGQRIAEERIDCQAGGRTTFAITHRFDAPGDRIIEARLVNDALPLDNRRWLSVKVRESMSVLCIGSKPADARNVALALAPQQQAGQLLDIVEATESRLADGNLSQFDCVVLSNVGRFSKTEAIALRRFVSGGGGLILFLGNQAQPAGYNQHLADDPQSRVLPAHLGEPVSTGNYAFDPLEYRHTIVGPFRGFPQSGLLSTPVWKYVRLAPLEGSTTALAFANGDPAIVETRIGRGRCVLVATSASLDSMDRASEAPVPWTALPTWPSFPPLLHEMVGFVLSGREEFRNVLVGEELSGTFPTSTPDAAVVLSGPGGLSERISVPIDSTGDQWTYGPIKLSGVYEAKSGSTSQLYTVNADSREGDLTRLDLAQLPSQLRREDAGLAGESAAIAAQQPTSLFRWLLTAALVLIVLEPCLAWQFGRGRG